MLNYILLDWLVKLKYSQNHLEKFNDMESGIRTQKSLESGIQELGIRNPSYDWIPLHGAKINYKLFILNRNYFTMGKCVWLLNEFKLSSRQPPTLE